MVKTTEVPKKLNRSQQIRDILSKHPDKPTAEIVKMVDCSHGLVAQVRNKLTGKSTKKKQTLSAGPSTILAKSGNPLDFNGMITWDELLVIHGLAERLGGHEQLLEAVMNYGKLHETTKAD